MEKEVKTEVTAEVKTEPVAEDVLVKSLTKLEDIVKALGKGETELTAEELAEEEAKKKKTVVKKSFVETAEEASDEIAKGLEISAFLKDLVGEVADSIDGITKAMGQSDETVKSIVKTQAEIGAIMKAFGDELKAQRTSIEALSAAPVTGRKAVITKGESRFDDEDAKLNPTTIKKALDDLFEKGQATVQDIVNYESSAYITPAMLGKVTKEVMA